MDVALVTVGDELLSGDTVNTNAAWLGRRLTQRGVAVEQVTVLPDRVADIARVVEAQRADFDAVIVTGGLGPTHDDRTMAGVAAAFDTDLVEHPAVLEWLTDEGYAAADLAAGTTHLPAGARPLHNDVGVAPGCVIGNVYVLPGVPEEMQGMFDGVAEEFTGEPQAVRTIRAAEPESALVDRLIAVEERFDVTIGSYPGEDVTIRLKGPDPDAVEAAAEWLAARVESA